MIINRVINRANKAGVLQTRRMDKAIKDRGLIISKEIIMEIEMINSEDTEEDMGEVITKVGEAIEDNIIEVMTEMTMEIRENIIEMIISVTEMTIIDMAKMEEVNKGLKDIITVVIRIQTIIINKDPIIEIKGQTIMIDKVKDGVKDKIKDKMRGKIKDGVKDKIKDKIKDMIKDRIDLIIEMDKDKIRDKTLDMIREMIIDRIDKITDTITDKIIINKMTNLIINKIIIGLINKIKGKIRDNIKERVKDQNIIVMKPLITQMLIEPIDSLSSLIYHIKIKIDTSK